MKYPIPDVSYKHTPKFVDRMKESEKEKPRPYTQADDGQDNVKMFQNDATKGD